MKILSSDGKNRSKNRLSVSLPDNDFELIKLIAERKNVSLAWVIREAVNEYVDKDIPLFRQNK